MFQKQDKMSLKKKSKSMGHLNLEPPSEVSPVASSSGHSAALLMRGASPFAAHPYISSGFGGQQFVPKKKSYPGDDIKSARTTPKKLKGLVRQRTNPMMMPVSVGKAIFSKANKGNGSSASSKSNPSSLSEVFGSKENVLLPNRHRAFLMDTQVKFTVGLQSQERNLFLFNDLLIIAKERSGNQFKLKDQIPLSDVWLATCLSEVSELTTDTLNSFVIGWPITNAIITFSSPNLKSVWWDKLSDLIEGERILAPSSTNIQVTYFDQSTNFEHVKSLSVTVRDDARACVSSALRSLEILGVNRSPPSPLVDSAAEYQLWVRTKSEEAPYPLIGHEIPLVIKLFWTRQAFINSRNQKSFDEYRAGCRCSFILRKTGVTYSNGGEDVASKNKLKKVKSSMKLQRVFRRASKHNDLLLDASDNKKSAAEEGKVFGRPLEEVVSRDEALPSAIIVILKRILSDGPETVGIFRRSPNARAMRELREKIDQNEKIDFEECSVFVVAALLKDFLRSLPDCLLQCPKYDEWIRVVAEYEVDKDIRALKNMISNLPRINEMTLKHLIYILKEIANTSNINMMSASNLGICVGPSVLWCTDSKVMMEQNYSKDVSCLIKTLIEEYEALFGPEIPSLFNMEENGSSTGGSNMMMLINSEESLLDPEPVLDEETPRLLGTSVPHRRPGGEPLSSLNNLSHDSGLTTSDSQLFLFESNGEVNQSHLGGNNNNNSFSSDDFCSLSNGSGGVNQHPKQKMIIKTSSNKIHIPIGDGRTPQSEQSHRVIVSRILRRTASEESLVILEGSKSPGDESRKRRPVLHRKGKAPPPPLISSSTSSGNNIVTRSNSVNTAAGKKSTHHHIFPSPISSHHASSSLWYRSVSTTRLNSSSTCSTDEEYRPQPENFVDGVTPPGYEETMSRQRLLKGANSFCIEDEEFEHEQGLLFDPPPLPPKTERPPLPPKQRQRKYEDTYVNCEDLRDNDSSDPANYNTHQGSTAVTIVSDEPVTNHSSSSASNKKRSVTRIVATNVAKSTRSVETQTEEKDFFSLYSSDSESDSSDVDVSSDGHHHHGHTLMDMSPTHRFQSDYYSGNQRGHPSSSSSIPDHLFAARSNPRARRLESQHQSHHPSGGGDPLVQGEINWSVSQLRSFFNQGQQKQQGNSNNNSNYGNLSGRGYPHHLDQRRLAGGTETSNNNNNSIICDANNILYAAQPASSPNKAEQDSDQESYV